jgi:hypothetical protein
MLEPLLLCYGALAIAALTNHRIRRDVRLPVMPPVAVVWAIAGLLLLLAAWRAVHHFGAYQGPVALVGMLCLAGLPLVLTLSRWPREALLAAIPVAVLAFGGMLLSA